MADSRDRTSVADTLSLQPEVRWRAGHLTITDPWRWIDPAALALFLNAGLFKADPRLAWAPVDLTLAGLVLIGLLAVRRVVFAREGIPRRIGWFVLWFALLAIPVLWTRWTPYSSEKVARLFTLTLGVALFSPILIRNRDAIWRLLICLASVGALLMLDALRQIVSDPVAYAAQLRLVAASANTIGLGRSVGTLIVVLAVVGARASARRAPLAWGAAGLGTVVLFAAGSRGPIVAAALAALLGVLLASGFTARTAGRLTGLLAVLAAAATVGWTLMPSSSADRLFRFVQYGFSDAAGNQSAADRPRFWADALRYSRSEPGGLGWGAFTQLPISGNSEDRYPHNLWIELALEAGWLASLATLAITLVAFVRAVAFAQSSDGVAGGALAALLLFGMTNASVSGDVNDNRILFALICVTICAPLPGAELDAEVKDERHAG